MKVLQITERYPPDDVGGAEIHVMHLSEALVKRGIDVSIASFSKVPGVRVFQSREREFRDNYWKTYGRPEYITSFGILKPFLASGDIGRIITSENPDVVHIHNLHDYSSAREAVKGAGRAGARLVWTVHDYWFVCPYNTLLDTERRICNDFRCFTRCFGDRPLRHRLLASFIKRSTGKLRLADTVIAPSHYMASILNKWGVKAVVVPYGHPAEPFSALPPPENGLKVLYAGALEPHKGIDVLIRAFDRIEGAELRIVGNGTLEAKVKKWADGWENVSVFPRASHSEMASHYAWSTVVVLPSIWPDNLPLTIIEAMLSARPVVASSVGGIPEMVAHRSTGLLFTPGDWKGLAHALTDIASEDIASMGTKAREAALRAYDMDTYLDRITDIYGGGT